MGVMERFDLASSALDVHPEIAALLEANPGIEPRIYRDGEFLMKEGEASQDIFVLLSGALVVEREGAAPGAPPAVLACITAEDGVAIVGEMAYLGSLRRTASVRSSGMSRLLRLEPAHVDRIIEGFPMLTRVICMQFSRRLQETLASLSTLQARFALNPGRRMAQDGEVLFTQGSPAGELHQLMAGSVRLEADGRVETVTPESLPQGFLHLEAYLKGLPHPATARVEGMAFLAVLGEADKQTVVRTFPDLVLEALRAGN
jgi:CRP-like cAMP-binding protein